MSVTAQTLQADPLLRDVPTREGFKILGPCVLYARLGSGGMGAVYRGHHLNLDLEVAVKCLRPALVAEDQQFLQRFRNEAKLAAALNDPRLIRVYDVAESSGVHYLVMELIQGETLRERVRRKGRLVVTEAVRIAYEAARGLSVAHSAGVVHRDIKPDNILISSKGEVKVADLGLAKLREGGSPLTQTHAIMGTPQYMAPEQWESAKTATAAADVWALGATLQFMLSGDDPIRRGEFFEIMRRICMEPFPDVRLALPEIPDEVAALLNRATAKSVEDRFRDATDFAEALETLLPTKLKSGALADASAGTHPDLSLVSPPPAATLARLRLEQSPRTAPTIGTNPPPKATPYILTGAIVLGLVAWIASSWSEWFSKPTPSASPTSKIEDVPRSPTAVTLGGWAKVLRSEPDPKIVTDPEARERISKSGLPWSVTDPATGIDFLLVPAGTYLRGASEEDELARDEERPQHLATVPAAFYLGRTEVTRAQWKTSASFPDDPHLTDQDPVYNVARDDIEEFCRRFGYRLPTELEWEYACRAGTTTPYSVGTSLRVRAANVRGETKVDELLERFGPIPVASYPPNPWGFYDLYGNVSEATSGWYDTEEYVVAAGGTKSRVLSLQLVHPIRGGSFQSLPERCRSSARGTTPNDEPHPAIGFRVVREP